MMISCPACSTRYVVPDNAIPAEGRTVRCAKCRHSWFQEGAADNLAEMSAGERHGPPPDPPSADLRPSESPIEDDAASPFDEPERIGMERPAFDSGEPEAEIPTGDGSPSHFEHEPPFRRRRDTLRLLTYAGVVFATVAAALIVAVSYFGLPEWVPMNRPTFGQAQDDLKLDFPPERQERRQLPNGAEFFGASGTITNTGSTARHVPPILIVLRDGRDRIVYSWEVYPPKRTLAPGETIAVSEGVTDVPRSARVAEIGWRPE